MSETEGALQLVDVAHMLPGLIYSPGKIGGNRKMKLYSFTLFLIGLETWQVGSRNLEFYKKFDEVDEKWKTTIRPQMFPPNPEDKEKYNLHKW